MGNFINDLIDYLGKRRDINQRTYKLMKKIYKKEANDNVITNK